jgi:predicted dehydrogenase
MASGETTDLQPARPIRLGMVGGGADAFIGAVHRMAARLDGHFELVAGALSATREKARRSGLALGLDPARCYGDFHEMAAAEAARPDGIEAVAIVTPNHMHADPAVTFLSAGVHVICDKPLAGRLADARRIAAAATQSRALFVLTHNYTGYPLVREARERVLSGTLGAIRVIQVEYPQDWLTEPLERTGQKQAAWRTDPARAGAGGCIGDIGTHAYNLADFVSGLEPESLLAELTTFVSGRNVDDNVQIMLRYRGGARGMLWASQVAPGNENALRIRVYGEKGGLAWNQEEPNSLRFTPFGRPAEIITRAGAGTGPAAARVTRIPTGHPEGYLEAFATLYTEAAGAIRAARNGARPSAETMFPGIADGLKGIAFIDAAVRSAAAGGVWTEIETLT